MPAVIESNLQNMLFERLRQETRDLHEKMERQLPIFSPQFSIAAYRLLLERYAGFYAPVEEKLTSLRDIGLAVFDDSRHKHDLLRLDLERLNFDRSLMAYIPRCPVLPALQSVSQGIGCMYVLEGSTLGGQIILRHLQKVLGITAENGGAFFSSYGAELGRRWKEFRETVAADERAHRETDEIVASARETFLCFYDWLAV